MSDEPRKVLIIEDDRAIARVLERNLLREGFVSRVAYDGADAAAILDREAFDYILCDYQLPDTTGAELCRQIRASDKHRDVPLALCTAKAHEVDTAALIREVGLSHVFFKPFSLREITAAIDSATTPVLP